MKFVFTVWEPIGTVEVEADTQQDAEIKVEENGLDAPSNGVVFDAGTDGQSQELRLEDILSDDKLKRAEALAGIEAEDVQRVAKDIFDTYLTDEQVIEALEAYPAEQEQDPTGSWDQVVEQTLYNHIEMENS